MDRQLLLEYESYYTTLLKQIREYNPVYVAIEGPECAGKTYLTKKLEQDTFTTDSNFKTNVRNILNKSDIQKHITLIAKQIFIQENKATYRLTEDLLLSGFLLYTNLLSTYFDIEFIHKLKETILNFEQELEHVYKIAYEFLPKDNIVIFDRFFLTQMLYIYITNTIDDYINETQNLIEAKDKTYTQIKLLLQENEFLINTILLKHIHSSQDANKFMQLSVSLNKDILVKTLFKRPIYFVLLGAQYKEQHGTDKLEQIYKQLLYIRYNSLYDRYKDIIDTFAYYNTHFVINWYMYLFDLFKANIGSFPVYNV